MIHRNQTPPHRIARPGLARAGWLMLVGLLLGTFAASIPISYQAIVDGRGAADASLQSMIDAVTAGRMGSPEMDALREMGLSLRFYAFYFTFFEVLLALVCTAAGAIIFWRRSDDWMALWVSLILVLLGTNGPWSTSLMLTTIWPGLVWVSTLSGAFGMISHLHLLLLSPDGRFTPRWTLALAAGFSGLMLAMGVYLMIVAGRWGFMLSAAFLLLLFPIWLITLFVGVGCQVYRYRRISGLVERQQTKWLAAGLAAVTLGFIANGSFFFLITQSSGFARVVYSLLHPPVVSLLMLLLPVCLLFSILRYRLWEIDLIIRRTLIYGSLTATLALVYYATVLLMQAVFRATTGDIPELALIISTLLIAVLFNPLRKRIQSDIDRRFFRRSYDAHQVLASFSTIVRGEVDLDHLGSSIMGVVGDTMQPASVSLWLKK